MKLFYRGNAYKTAAPTQLDSNATDQPKIKFIYRGHAYYATPGAAMISKAVEPTGQSVTLIYRGSQYVVKRQPSKPYHEPRAINWRWQF